MNFLYTFLILLIASSILLVLNYRRSKGKRQLEEELSANWTSAKDEYFNFYLIERYFHNRVKYTSDLFQIISEKVSDDLYLSEVFKFVDRTVSKIGQQFLYYKLRVVSKDIEQLQHFDCLVEDFQHDKAQRVQCQLELRALENGESYYFEELLHGEPIQPPKWYPLVYILSFAVLTLSVLAIAFPVLLLFLFPLFILNILIHYWNKQNINYYLIALGELGKAYRTANRLSRIDTVRKHFQDVAFLKQLMPLRKKMKWVSLSNKFENDSTTIFYSLSELLKITFNLEILFFFSLIKDVEKKREPLHELFQFIGEVDAAISTASLRAGLPEFCKPVFCDAKQLDLEGLTHPLIKDCVPNDLQLSQKSLLLTGSNMAGKTTFIRAVGINMLLAQTIYTCTANRFCMPFSRIYTSIKITDDLLTEKSYYFEEVSTIKTFIDDSQSTEPSVFILDEIFKGTNTVERISGGKAILSYLSRGNHFVFVSTHDIELTELLKNQFDLYHFSEFVQDGQLVFDHKIKPGPLTTRNAIKILEMSLYPVEIIEEANDIVNAIEDTYS